MTATIILWPLLLVGVVVVCLSWIKMRERVPLNKRSKIEQIVTILLILFLLIDIGHAVLQRKNITEEMNDCIGFYRYFPSFHQPEKNFQFSFLKKCKDYFSDEEIQQLRESGLEWGRRQAETNLNSNLFQLNFTGGFN